MYVGKTEFHITRLDFNKGCFLCLSRLPDKSDGLQNTNTIPCVARCLSGISWLVELILIVLFQRNQGTYGRSLCAKALKGMLYWAFVNVSNLYLNQVFCANVIRIDLCERIPISYLILPVWIVILLLLAAISILLIYIFHVFGVSLYTCNKMLPW